MHAGSVGYAAICVGEELEQRVIELVAIPHWHFNAGPAQVGFGTGFDVCS